MRKSSAVALAALAAAWVFSPGVAMSANVIIRDLNGTIAVDFSEFDFEDWQYVGPVGHATVMVDPGNGQHVTITGQFITNSDSEVGGNTIYLFTPGTSNGTTAAVSDYVTSAWNVTTGGVADITLDYFSATNGAPPVADQPLSAGMFVDGTLQDLTPLLSLPKNITVYAQADVNELTLPEPASLVPFGVGLAGLGAIRRRGA